jgi:hypothetical protein
MNIEITQKQFMEAALQQEKDALAFFDSDEFKSMPSMFGMSDEFLDKKRAEIAEIERKLETGEYNDE